ncbi:uncharacterized protein METZ01_LOCUS161394 [marine metagenome]|uniref:Lumazine-binding domain-containing protein n=1 Tax=marine metagenome TaxID=408172 RepID=A0A382B3Y9_9ZZZZ
MFSGIIQGIGFIDNLQSNNTFIRTSLDLSDCKIGSSISCNGVCLTATSVEKLENNDFIFSVNISEETRNRSNFFYNNLNQKINIEKSIKAGDEISGHFVYGHVDCITKISKIHKLDLSWNFEFQKDNTNKDMERFIVQKGSIAINGISLTVANVSSDNFFISIVPYTYENTNLNSVKENDLVNIEFDALARYVFKNE